jgi:glycosyltransferase involved in cell wall biosynthesis
MFQDENDGPPIGVDVAIPCYQYGRFLRDCVESVLTQGIRHLRVLIIDNASTDDSAEIAQQLAAEDRRVEFVVHPRNLGHHASFNEAIDWASSKYFMILGADDFLAPGCLRRAVSIMERHSDVGLAYGRLVFWHRPQEPRPVFDSSTQDVSWRIVPGRQLLERLCRLPSPAPNFIDTPTVVVRTSVQKRVGYYRPELTNSDDMEMWMRFACLGAVAETDAVQAVVGVHPTRRSASLTVGWDRLFEIALESFLANEGGLLPEAKRLRRTARRSLAARAYWRAVLNLMRGNTRESLDLWKFAFTRCPTTIVVPPVSYLFRRPDAFQRIIEVVSKAVRQTGKPLSEGEVRR